MEVSGRGVARGAGQALRWLALLAGLTFGYLLTYGLILLGIVLLIGAGAGATDAGVARVLLLGLTHATQPLALLGGLTAAFVVWWPLRRRRTPYARGVLQAEALHDRAVEALERQRDALPRREMPADDRWRAATLQAVTDMEAAARRMCDLGPVPAGAERADALSKRIGAEWLAILADYRPAVERADAAGISACHDRYAALGPLYDQLNREVDRLR
jgi:hypothetical protein